MVWDAVLFWADVLRYGAERFECDEDRILQALNGYLKLVGYAACLSVGMGFEFLGSKKSRGYKMKPLIPVDIAAAKLFDNMPIVLYETCVP